MCGSGARPLQVKSLHRGFVVICPKKKQVYRAQFERVVNDLTMELASVSALFVVFLCLRNNFRRFPPMRRENTRSEMFNFLQKKKVDTFGTGRSCEERKAPWWWQHCDAVCFFRYNCGSSKCISST